MNDDRIQGNRKQLTGKIKGKWCGPTDDDLTRAQGSSEYLADKVQ